MGNGIDHLRYHIVVLVVRAGLHLDRITCLACSVGDGRENRAVGIILRAVLHRRAVAVVIDPPHVGCRRVGRQREQQRSRYHHRQCLFHFCFLLPCVLCFPWLIFKGEPAGLARLDRNLERVA